MKLRMTRLTLAAMIAAGAVQALADGITVSEDKASAYVPTTIVNGSFDEEPWMDFTYDGVTYYSCKNDADFSSWGKVEATDVVFNGVDGGWNTTERSWWHSSLFEYANGNIPTHAITHNTSISNTGKYVEMNCYHACMLYQDLTTHGNDVIRWSLNHAVTTGGDETQAMRVEIGAPNRDGSGNIVNASGWATNLNPQIELASKAIYRSTGVTDKDGNLSTFGFGSVSELQYLTVTKTDNSSGWWNAQGVYVVPQGQSVTRFGFVSEASTPDRGNLLDDITFSTLIGNLSARQLESYDVELKGYWGETDATKSLKVVVGTTTYNVDMTPVVGKNFKISIPATTIGAATSVHVYHQDYEDAGRTISLMSVLESWEMDYTGDIQTFTAPCSGIYQLRAWGAQGSYATCRTTLTKGETIYIYVGGTDSTSGGGATRISKVQSLDDQNFIIVAGGGDGNSAYNSSLASNFSTTAGQREGNGKAEINLLIRGAGTADDPCLIGNTQELKNFAALVNSGSVNIHGKLTAPIDLEGSQVNQWTPIGTSSHKYNGTFDGQGFTISDLYYVQKEGNVGLFGCANSHARIKNVRVEGYIDNSGNGATGPGATTAGGILGKGENGTVIINCSVAGAVLSYSNVGGIAGGGAVTIVNCYNEATVKFCSNNGQVGGGIYGWGGSPTIINCYNVGQIINTGDATSHMGNIAAVVSSATNCYSLENSCQNGKNAAWSNGAANQVPGITMMSEAMHSQSFVSTLNSNALALWSTYPDIDTWMQDPTTGRPILNLSYRATEGPWTRIGENSGCCETSVNPSIAWKYLNNTQWNGTIIPFKDNTNGIGTTMQGAARQWSKQIVFTLYETTQTVPSYSVMVWNWNFQMKGHYQGFAQQTGLYAHTDLSALQSTALDFTYDHSDGAGDDICVGLFYHNAWTLTQDVSQDKSHNFWFDNRNGSTERSQPVYMIQTHSAFNGTDVDNNPFGPGWVSFKDVSSSYTYYYYKHITFNANGGSGSMAQQQIENSGNLLANNFVREGYQFAGWNTSLDGSGTSYSNEAAITATAASKGPLTLYAQWVDNYSVWAEENSVTGAWDEEDASGVPNAFRYVFNEPEGKVEVVSDVDVVGTSVKMTTPEIKKNEGFTVKYELDQVAASGEVLSAGTASNSADDLGIDFASVKSNAYFKVAMVLESTDGTAAQTKVLSDTTIGVLAITNAPATAIIGAPWVALSGGAISVSNLVYTANLTEGDTIKVYDATAKSYKMWELEEDAEGNKEWVPSTTTTTGGSSTADEASEATIPRGVGVWLTRQHPEAPIYLVGMPKEGKVATPLDTPEETGTKTWNLVASPKVEPVDVAELLDGKEDTDKVMVPTAGAPKNFLYRNGNWGYIDYESGDDGLVYPVFKTDTTIPAGTGFWYLNGNPNRDKLEWE